MWQGLINGLAMESGSFSIWLLNVERSIGLQNNVALLKEW